MHCFAISFEMSFYCSGFDALSARFSRSEFGGVHSQGTIDVANWLLVLGQGLFLGPSNLAVNSSITKHDAKTTRTFCPCNQCSQIRGRILDSYRIFLS